MTDKKWYGKDSEEDIIFPSGITRINNIKDLFKGDKPSSPPHTTLEYFDNYRQNLLIYGNGHNGLSIPPEIGNVVMSPDYGRVTIRDYMELLNEFKRNELKKIKEDFFEEYPGLEILRDTMPFEAIIKISGTQEFYYAQAIILEEELNEQEDR